MFVDTQQRPQGEQVDAIAPSKMKLSAAIRIGAKIRPQCTGVLFDGFGSCALGAAIEGRGASLKRGMTHSALRWIAPELWSEKHGDINALAHKIIAKNDSLGRQSRESIADWLESQGL